MNNIKEIVFGDSLYNEMKDCSLFKNNQILKFDALFSIADLSNIDLGIVKLNKDFCNLINSEKIYEIEETISLKSVTNKFDEIIKNSSQIRIWTTHNQIDSYLMFLYVCNYFANHNCKLCVLFSDEYDKECYSPSCMNSKELEELISLEHKLSKGEILEYKSIWKQLVRDNSNMRVLDNHKVKSVSFDYYNSIILSKLSELGEVKTAKLVGNLMKEYHLYDTVFYYLISRLIKQNKIKIIREEKILWKSIIKKSDK